MTVALLGAIFSYAARQGIQPDNPVHGFAEGWRQRRLTDDEYRQGALAGGSKNGASLRPLIGGCLRCEPIQPR